MSGVSSLLMILYDLSYNCRTYVLTVFYDNPKLNIIIG